MKKNNKKRDRWLVISLLCICAAIVLVLIGNFITAPRHQQTAENLDEGNKFSVELDPNAEEGAIPTKSPEEIQEELNAKVAEGMINITMNTYPIFENGSAKGNLLIYNDTSNNYPQVVEIYHEDELIYRSGLIPVGSRIEEAKLLIDLPKGEYPCVAYFNSVDDNGNILGTAGAQITICVNG